MLILKINSDLYNYWPVVLLTGAMTIVVILISIFMYIDHKELAEQKAKALMTPTTVLLPRKARWNRFLKWLGIVRENDNVDDVEEYKDRSGRFQFIGIIIILVVIVSIISSFDFPELPDWLSFLFHRWWFWAVLIVLIMLISLRKKVFKKRSIKWSLKGLWWRIGVIAFALLLWFTIIPYSIRWYNWQTRPSGSGNSSSIQTSSTRAFFLNKDNAMKAGVWYTFTQDEGPLLRFKPKNPNTTIIYEVVKNEDPTRNWKVEVWTNSANEVFENRLNAHGIEPIPTAKRGDSRIRVSVDAVIVVY
jgi:magnesium-transporting ATPase (P-type)